MLLCVRVANQPLHLLGLHTDTKYVLFCLSVALWGTTNGFAQAAVEAILGDSVPTGNSSLFVIFMGFKANVRSNM